MSSSRFRVGIEEALAMCEDESSCVRNAGFTLFARLEPPEIAQALPRLIQIALRPSDGPRYGEPHVWIESALQDVTQSFEPLMRLVREEHDPQVIELALEVLYHLLIREKPGPTPLAAPEEDVARVEALLDHGHLGIRAKAAMLLSTYAFAPKAIDAPLKLTLWLTDQTQGLDWYPHALRALSAFGRLAVPHLVRALTNPEEIVAESNVPVVIDRLPRIVRDRAGEVLLRMGERGRGAARALLTALRSAIAEESDKAQLSRQHLCRAFMEVKPGSGLGEQVREIVAATKSKDIAATLSRYFHLYPVEGVVEIMAMLDAGHREDALDALLEIAIEAPDRLDPYGDRLARLLESNEPHLYLRAAAVFAGMGKRATDLYPKVLERFATIISETRARCDQDERASHALGYLLSLEDSIRIDRGDQARAHRHSVHIPYGTAS